MSSDPKADLRRLVENSKYGDDEDVAAAVYAMDPAALLQRLEELEAEAILTDEDAMVQAHDASERIAELESEVARLEVNVYQNVKLRTEVAKLEADNQRLREAIASELTAQAQERGEYDDYDPHYTSKIDPERYM